MTSRSAAARIESRNMSSCPERAEGGVPVAHPPRITGSSADEPIRVLHRGFDGLDMAFTGALRSKDVAILESARSCAESEFGETLIEVGPGRVAMHVAAEGIPGGYRYQCDTGPFGEKWFFSRNQDPDRWNIRVSAKSLPLALYGIETVYEKIRETLSALGIRHGAESVGRVDYATDLLMPDGFQIEPDHFVVHSRTSVTEHDSMLPVEKIGPDDILISLAGRHKSSTTIGKQPGRQVIVYDKRREAIAKNKLYWFDIWGLPTDTCLKVVRVEVRAGKKHLLDWEVRGFDDLLVKIGDVFLRGVDAVRYVDTRVELSNVSRYQLSPLWRVVQHEIASGLFENISGAEPGRVIAGERERIRQRYLEMIEALVPGAFVASGFTDADADDGVQRLLAEVAQHISTDPKKFRSRCTGARKRLHFVVCKS